MEQNHLAYQTTTEAAAVADNNAKEVPVKFGGFQPSYSMDELQHLVEYKGARKSLASVNICFQRVTLSRGESIMTNALYFVLFGELTVRVNDGVRFAFKGELVGLDLLHSSTALHTITASDTEAVQLIRISRDMISSYPQEFDWLLPCAAQSLFDARREIFLRRASCQQRLARYLLKLFDTQVCLGLTAQSATLKWSRPVVAEVLEFSNETMSRELHHLCRHGAISIRCLGSRSVDLIDRKLLERIAGVQE